MDTVFCKNNGYMKPSSRSTGQTCWMCPSCSLLLTSFVLAKKVAIRVRSSNILRTMVWLFALAKFRPWTGEYKEARRVNMTGNPRRGDIGLFWSGRNLFPKWRPVVRRFQIGCDRR
eukprot:scaffold49657_cov55-Attheya_sp.AAC.2